MSIKGWPTQEKDDRLSPQYATVEPVRQLQQGLSVLSHEFVREVGTDAVEANSTTTVINATGHAAQVGDVIRLTSGTLSGQEIKVYSVATNAITLAEELSSAPALGVTFQILRHKYPIVEATGEVKVTGSFTEVATAADGGALPAVVKVVGGYDGSAVQVIKTDAAGELQVDVLSSALPTGAATASNQTGGSQKTQVVDGSGDVVDVVALNVALTATDKGLVTNTVIHGESSGGGGGYVDVKVTPSGALVTESSISSIADVDGQKTMALSFPVVIASDQSAIPITDNAGSITVDGTVAATQSGTWNITNVSGTVSLPTGAATETTLSTLNGKIPSSLTVTSTRLLVDGSGVTQPVSGTVTANAGTGHFNVVQPTAASLNATVAQSGTWNITNVSGTVSLPTGAATASNQTGGSQKTQIVDGSGNVIASTTNALNVSAVQSGTWNITNVSGTVSLPTGAATAAKQPALGTAGAPSADVISVQGLSGMVPLQVDGSNYALQVSTITTSIVPGTSSTHLGKAVDAASGGTDTGVASLVVRNDSLSAITPVNNDYTTIRVNNLGRIWANTGGRTATNRARNDYSSTSVSTTAYTQLLASTSAIIQEVEIFDSSGQTLFLATGASGSEVDQVYIFPGGNGRIPLYIANATRVAIKAVSALANTGEIAVNFYS